MGNRVFGSFASIVQKVGRGFGSLFKRKKKQNKIKELNSPHWSGRQYAFVSKVRSEMRGFVFWWERVIDYFFYAIKILN